ncbi:hypothetical protein AYO40_01765 [Planctomycetaceae bacterium SCGC AG-212-D15]|nr:hypothetical protein AYO40_01765 [Planctomycetaceae bacterium SCGC AG-212-D15]
MGDHVALTTNFFDSVSKDKEFLRVEGALGHESVLVDRLGRGDDRLGEQARVNVDRTKGERTEDVAEQIHLNNSGGRRRMLSK